MRRRVSVHIAKQRMVLDESMQSRITATVEAIDTTTAAGRMMKNLVGAFAEFRVWIVTEKF